MPGLVRKLVIFAAVDGLVLQPLGQRPAPAAKISYKDNSIVPVLNDGESEAGLGKSFEAFGIVGMFLASTGGARCAESQTGLKNALNVGMMR